MLDCVRVVNFLLLIIVCMYVCPKIYTQRAFKLISDALRPQTNKLLLLLRAPERLDRRVKSICLLNVVIKQGILINTHKTKQSTSCRVTCNRVPFITRYCVFIQVMTQH